jgi:putative nucleotidyltransferase with HDIG domain
VSDRNRVLYALVAAVCLAGLTVVTLATVSVPRDVDFGRLLFWLSLTLLASLAPVKLPGGIPAYPNTAPLLATIFDAGLANPFGVVWVALLGTFALREIRREVPWYGTLYNHFNFVLAGSAAWLAVGLSGIPARSSDPLGIVAQLVVAGLAFGSVNIVLAVAAGAARTGNPVRRVWAMSIRNVGVGFLAQVPLGWLMAEIGFKVGLWATVLFAVPLFLARYSFSKFVEMRELFFGSVSALSQAIDAKDGYTRGHADRVSRIAGAIAQELGLADAEVEKIELAAMLHDIGKIGVEDKILLKPARLDEDEVVAMQRHPIYGASILEPSSQLRSLVPIVLHHHEHYDGSGYPDGLIGEEIPIGSRIILVSDAYEAMTSDRVYRKAIGHERALDQLKKYQRIQFDPKVVDAFLRVLEKRGMDAFEASELPPIAYETLAEVRDRLSREPRDRPHSHAG